MFVFQTTDGSPIKMITATGSVLTIEYYSFDVYSVDSYVSCLMHGKSSKTFIGRNIIRENPVHRLCGLHGEKQMLPPLDSKHSHFQFSKPVTPDALECFGVHWREEMHDGKAYITQTDLERLRVEYREYYSTNLAKMKSEMAQCKVTMAKYEAEQWLSFCEQLKRTANVVISAAAIACIDNIVQRILLSQTSLSTATIQKILVLLHTIVIVAIAPSWVMSAISVALKAIESLLGDQYFSPSTAVGITAYAIKVYNGEYYEFLLHLILSMATNAAIHGILDYFLGYRSAIRTRGKLKQD